MTCRYERCYITPAMGRLCFWPIVAAFGALWGVAEVTMGTFLHTLHIPFSGVFLACCGAALLVAQRQVLNRPGAALATGFVTATIKTMSPGGAIIGPMLGILVESILVEVCLLLLSRNLPGAMLGGAFVAVFAAFQKVFMQFVYYGGNVIELYLSILREAADTLGLEETGRTLVCSLVLGGLGLVGAGFGVLGLVVGQKGAQRLAMAQGGR